MLHLHTHLPDYILRDSLSDHKEITPHQKYLNQLELDRRARARQNLTQFLHDISPPDWTYEQAHLQYIIKHLQMVETGQIKRLMMFCPPRHGKSATSTIRFAVYYLERHLEDRVVVAAHTQSLANDFSRESRKIAGLRHFEINPKRDAVEDWRLQDGGQYTSIGVGGGITGRGANLLIIDDPVKSAEKANSLVDRDRVWRWYQLDISTRLEPDARMILIMTRWHGDDLAGRILDSTEAGEWTIINLPAEAEDNDLLGRQVGEALWRERFNEEYLARMRMKLGKDYNALYQQRPTAAEGNIFRLTNIQYYKPADLPLAGYILCSWDTALGLKKANDYSVGVTWLHKDGNFYLLNVIRGRYTNAQLEMLVRGEYAKYRGNMILIENKSGGEPLRQEIQRKGGLPILMVNLPAGCDKVTRAQCVSGLFDAGRIYLPEAAPWLSDYLTELSEFPAAKYDDQVDATSQALEYLQRTFGYVIHEVKQDAKPQLIETWRFGDGRRSS